jgi:DNA-binding CsgD family transcriptional regulator
VREIGDDAREAVDALRTGRVKDAFAAVARASTAFDALKPGAVAAAPVNALLVGGAQLAHERLPAAAQTLERGITAVKGTDHGPLIAALATTRAVTLTPMLRLARASADLELATAKWRAFGVEEHLLVALTQQAVVADLRADDEASRAVIAESRRLAGRLPESAVTRGRLCRLAALGVADDPERCIEDVLREGGADLEVLDPTSAVQLMGVLVRACMMTGRRSDAEQWAARMSRRAAVFGLPIGRARARAARGALLLATGDGAGAADLTLQAAELADRLGARADALAARLLAAKGLQVAGDERQAVGQLELVVDAPHTAERLRNEALVQLRHLGITVYEQPTDPATMFARLSASERQIMALVLTGQSTEQVASTVALSESAVRHQLSSVFNKVGARSRGELAAFAARLQPDGQRAQSAK